MQLNKVYIYVIMRKVKIMEEKVSVNISARHVHLTKEAHAKLFDHDLTVRNPLNQVGQFAANETVTVKTDKGVFENVRIIGPLRSYNQVELSMTDARKLGIKPPVRKSGNLNGAEMVTIATEKGEITEACCIIADRHVHMNPAKAQELGVVDDEVLKLAIPGDKSGVIDVHAKVSDDGYYEVHLDTDDANAFLINPGDIGTISK